MTKQHDIGFDKAVIACASYLLRSNGRRIKDVVREMLQAYDPDMRRGTVGDLEILKQYGLPEESAKQQIPKETRPVHVQAGGFGGYKMSLCGRFLNISTPTTNEASSATCKHCLKKLSKEGKP